MNCAQCGKKLALADRFCSQCGSSNRMLDGLLDVPPEGPTTQQPVIGLPASTAPVVSATVLGIKWLQFWTYFSLPVGGISFGLLCFAVPDWKLPFAFLAGLHFYTAYGLHRRFLWAWQGNWALVVVSWVGAAVPSDFGSPIDFAFKYAFVFLLGGLVWMWPNYVYWMKRRGLFQEENGAAR